jgi:RNA polymerase sigma-70 factor (ECF subfamily)
MAQPARHPPMPPQHLLHMGPSTEPRQTIFERDRRRLTSLAFRIVGSRAEAEDIVQEAWLRWHRSADELRSTGAWLTTVVTRLAVDHLRSARNQREIYTGIWLPEPIVERRPWDAASAAETASELSIAFLYLMENLNPEERAAFVLREAFDYPYTEVAAYLDKSEAACRQLVHRARERLRRQQRRPNSPRQSEAALIDRYVNALLAHDETALLQLLADDATELADGGGKVAAALHPIQGAPRIARLLLGLAKKYEGRFSIERVVVNSQPGLILRAGASTVVASFETDGEKITRIFHILNPAKLGRLQTATG